MKKKKEIVEVNSNQQVELKKHVALIHSNSKISLLQRKIANALLYNAFNDLMDKTEYEINIGSLCKLIGYHSNDHKTIKNALINLLSTVIEWNLVDGEKIDKEGIWNASSMIADASIDGAICTYSYSNKMRKLLFRPNMYGRLNMTVQAKFQSCYGLALYENCNRYQDIGQTPWFDFYKFRKLMGVDDSKYKVFRDFKTRVIDKAIDEVNKYSQIKIFPQLRKRNRRVVAIQFLIERSEISDGKALINVSKNVNLEEDLTKRFCLSKKQTADILANYNEQYVQEKIKLVETSSSYKTGKIENIARYLLSAIKDDYQPRKSSQALISSAHEMHEQRAVNEKEILNKQIEVAQEIKRDVVRKYLEGLNRKEKNNLMINFENYLREKDSFFMYKKYKEVGLRSPSVKAMLNNFINELLDKNFREIA